MASRDTIADTSAIEDEIAQLEAKLRAARGRLRAAASADQQEVQPPDAGVAQLTVGIGIPPRVSSADTFSTHFLLLLSDSQLPVGSFAFSSGLESFLAHTPRRAATFATFLPLSLSSFASTTLPFVLAAHRQPPLLAGLDDQLDAAIVCTVGRRASTAQGRALLSIWERSFCATMPPRTAYVFMLSHVKALVSAAVRASMFGPYQAQKVLAGEKVQNMINAVIDREWDTPVEDAGQSVPVMDLWIGRHEVLYSRIFNS
ncbi:putative urease accessory protein UreF-like [Beauveria bassiana]|uniref:Putative urease accessory protein UreF-like n=1 Tax=Beauveria bassiana TaxID=176275 RepID=A0A2N6NN19_BEABA|nr:putative urease accessory protein UreF-like [Beauveria bassiana]